MNIGMQIYVVLMTGLGAVAGDLKSFADFRQKDRTAQFDWVLCGTKFAYGAITGLLGVASASALGGSLPQG
jgi:hypothetical protein